MTVKEIKKVLEEIYDDERCKTLGELNAVKYVGINDEKDSVVLIIEEKEKGTSAEANLKRKIAKAIKIDLGFSGVKIQFEEAKTSTSISSKDTKFILIAGQKGGVGRSTITINLAYSLKQAQKKVAIIDCDIYNASIAKMLNIKDQGLNVDNNNKIIPYEFDGIQVISTDFFQEDKEPVMWRGEMLSSMINNYLFQVAWDKDLDYVLLDLGAGTGDILLDIQSNITSLMALIITNDDRNSLYQSLKSYKALKDLNIDILGYVLNRSKDLKKAKEYLENNTQAEVLTSISESSLDDNYHFTSKDAQNAISDLKDMILIQ